MSSIQLITHRMLAAVAAQESRQAAPAQELPSPWPEAGFAHIEVLDPADWMTPLSAPASPNKERRSGDKFVS
jgi:hypothetical protein